MAKIMLPTFEKSQGMIAADDMEDTVEKLQTHVTMQMMKAVAVLKTYNSWKKNICGRGGAVYGQ